MMRCEQFKQGTACAMRDVRHPLPAHPPYANVLTRPRIRSISHIPPLIAMTCERSAILKHPPCVFKSNGGGGIYFEKKENLVRDR